MNNVLKFGLRTVLKKASNPLKILMKPNGSLNILNTNYSRPLWHMCSSSGLSESFVKQKPIGELCHCGCSGFSTKVEKDLAEYLTEEIEAEKKNKKMESLPNELNGFQISWEMAELVFEKKTAKEVITVSMNVNHSVDADENEDSESYSEEMTAKPAFEVDIVRNKKTLSFTCSFTQFDKSNEGSGDSFEITEITYFEDDWSDKTYSVAADLLDENLYDLFMLVLEEKGITRSFALQASAIATAHEHLQYIGLLENVKKFTSAH